MLLLTNDPGCYFNGTITEAYVIINVTKEH